MVCYIYFFIYFQFIFQFNFNFDFFFAILHLSLHISIDSLECPSCGYQKQSNASFQDIPLNLTEKIGNQGILLTEMLQHFSAVEILDASNLWKCGNCSQNVQAKKSTQLQSLPTTLFLHLKRFGYDQVFYLFIYLF